MFFSYRDYLTHEQRRQEQQRHRSASYGGGDLFSACVTAPCEGGPGVTEKELVFAATAEHAYPGPHSDSNADEQGLGMSSAILDRIPSPAKRRSGSRSRSTILKSAPGRSSVVDYPSDFSSSHQRPNLVSSTNGYALEPSPASLASDTRILSSAFCLQDQPLQNECTGEIQVGYQEQDFYRVEPETREHHQQILSTGRRSSPSHPELQNGLPLQSEKSLRARPVKDASPLLPVNASSSPLQSPGKEDHAWESVSAACSLYYENSRGKSSSSRTNNYPVAHGRPKEQECAYNLSRSGENINGTGIFETALARLENAFGSDQPHGVPRGTAAESMPPTQFSLAAYEPPPGLDQDFSRQLAVEETAQESTSKSSSRRNCEIPEWIYGDCLEPAG